MKISIHHKYLANLNLYVHDKIATKYGKQNVDR